MDVLLLASQPFLNRLKREEKQGLNPRRYEPFRQLFGDKYGFVLAGDVLEEAKTGKKAQVYKFGNCLYPYEAEEEGVGCHLLFASSFGCREESARIQSRFPSRGEVEEIVSYLDIRKNKGDIGYIINSKKGTLSEDKISLLELQAQGIKMPETFHFRTLEDLKDFLHGNPEEKYVLKHRWGYSGESLFLVDRKNIQDFSGLRIEDYILQEKVDISSEKRLIFFDQELLASRIIIDRHMPWENEGQVGRRHTNLGYTPSDEEVKESREILGRFGSTIGCIDWIDVNGERLFMEYNGAGTGYGGQEDHYDLNGIIPERLKEKYF